MSYTIARSFHIDLSKLTLSLSGACNNVTPRTYGRSVNVYKPEEFDVGKVGVFTPEEGFLLWTMKLVEEGSVQLSRSVNTDVRYAFARLSEELARRSINLYDTYNNIVYKKNFKELDVIKEIIHRFKALLTQEDIPGDYVVQIGGQYLNKLNRSTYKITHSLFGAKVFKSYKEAWMSSMLLHGSSVISMEHLSLK